MNCQDFESNLDGLARGALMDARARETALAHERACARCAARLADERAITSGMRALADATKDACAHARVEAVLLASLRAQVASNAARESSVVLAEGASAASGGVTSSVNESIGQLSVNENVKQFSWAKTIAVAALAAAAAVALFMLIPPGMNVPASKTKDTVAGTQPSGHQQGVTSNVGSETATNGNGAGEEVSPVSPEDGERRSIAQAVVDGSRDSRGAVARRTPRAIRATPANLNTGGPQSLGETSEANESEITTDFIPLMQGARLTQTDGVRMVRVELPRSALARFGLPVNAEQTNGRVKADVLLGEDGLARAIRFVR
jgi:hypothetical protein